MVKSDIPSLFHQRWFVLVKKDFCGGVLDNSRVGWFYC